LSILRTSGEAGTGAASATGAAREKAAKARRLRVLRRVVFILTGFGIWVVVWLGLLVDIDCEGVDLI
jgi:hypothetical protein